MRENRLRHVPFFAGIGGFSVGLKKVGFEIVFTNDFEEACIETLNYIHPKATDLHGSITDNPCLEVLSSLEDIDIVSGRFPCQPLSVAGSQDGFNDLQRGSRLFDMMEAISQMPFPPKVLLLENVPNLLRRNEIVI